MIKIEPKEAITGNLYRVKTESLLDDGIGHCTFDLKFAAPIDPRITDSLGILVSLIERYDCHGFLMIVPPYGILCFSDRCHHLFDPDS